MHKLEPFTVDTKTACLLLGCKRGMLFRYLREGLLERRKYGRKTCVTMASLKALAERGHS